VIGTSKGKGFQGGVKRWHFRGGPKTHGQSDRHRAPGSIGAGTTPGRVLKGQKMAGHMGHQRVTVQNLRVVDIDPEHHVLLVKGAIPGSKGGKVIVTPAVKAKA
jgi:large subunit ribosomal protein L3